MIKVGEQAMLAKSNNKKIVQKNFLVHRKKTRKQRYTEKMNSALVGNKPLHIFLENTDELFKFLEIGLKSYDETFKYLNSFKILNKSTNLIFGKPWVNVKKDNEYIPNHIHDGIYAYSIRDDIPYKTIFEFSYSNILGEHFREKFFIEKKYFVNL